MEPSEAIATLRAFNAWRRNDEDTYQPDPRLIGQAIEAICHHAERMERELEQERQDRNQADLDTIRALGERNDARAELCPPPSPEERRANARAIQWTPANLRHLMGEP